MDAETSINFSFAASPVRLVSDDFRTANLSAGRLEIFIGNQWGTICGHNFDNADAEVACRQLGFERSNTFSLASQLGYVMVYDSMDRIRSDGDKKYILNYNNYTD